VILLLIAVEVDMGGQRNYRQTGDKVLPLLVCGQVWNKVGSECHQCKSGKSWRILSSNAEGQQFSFGLDVMIVGLNVICCFFTVTGIISSFTSTCVDALLVLLSSLSTSDCLSLPGDRHE
jgi:hypothetical protein